MIKGKVDGTEQLAGTMLRVTARIFSETKKILRTEAVLMASHIKSEHLTGGTSATRLAVRTGNLRSQCRSLPVTESPGLIESGVGFGTQYARAHIGPRGQVTTIRAKSGKFLAIPLAAAKTPSGVPKGSPRSGPWGDTFFLRSRSKPGELILFGKAAFSKGARAGQLKQGFRRAGGGIVPLFLMVKQVKVRARVHPEAILSWEKPKMIAAFRNVGVNLRG